MEPSRHSQAQACNFNTLVEFKAYFKHAYITFAGKKKALNIGLGCKCTPPQVSIYYGISPTEIEIINERFQIAIKVRPSRSTLNILEAELYEVIVS